MHNSSLNVRLTFNLADSIFQGYAWYVFPTVFTRHWSPSPQWWANAQDRTHTHTHTHTTDWLYHFLDRCCEYKCALLNRKPNMNYEMYNSSNIRLNFLENWVHAVLANAIFSHYNWAESSKRPFPMSCTKKKNNKCCQISINSLSLSPA